MNLLVIERLHLHGFNDVRDELRVDVGVADLLVQQHAHGALALGADLLWLVAHVQQRRFRCTNTRCVAMDTVAVAMTHLHRPAAGVQQAF